MNAQSKAPRIVTHGGELYFHYAGPFKDRSRAESYAEDCFAAGEWSDSDRPIYKYASLYILAH